MPVVTKFMSNSNIRKPSACSDLIWIGFASAVFFFLLLGSRPLLSPDGGRYAEIAREMLARHDFLTPHLNNIKYFQKPPLYYWLLTFVMHFIDQSMLALRSVNAVLGVVGVLATYGFTRLMYGYQTARLAAAILACNALYFGMINIVNLDLSVSVFINLALFSFYLSTRPAFSTKAQYLLKQSATIFSALATLTKGLIGFVIPLMVILIWIVCKRDLLRLRWQPFTLFSCLMVFLLITAPWHILMQIHNPEFVQFYLFDQHIQRYLSSSFEHREPLWYFAPVLFVLFLPWSLSFIHTARHAYRSIKQGSENGDVTLFLVIQILFIFIFFSCSKSKLISYVVPLVPALSILTAYYLQPHCQRYPRFFYTTIISTAIILLSLLLWIGKHDQRSTLPIANYLHTHAKPTDLIVHYHKFYHDLPFYMQRTMTVVEWDNELKYGMQHEDTSDWMINDPVFWQQWNSSGRVWAVLESDQFERFQKQSQRPVHLFYKDSNKFLVSNQGNS